MPNLKRDFTVSMTDKRILSFQDIARRVGRFDSSGKRATESILFPQISLHGQTGIHLQSRIHDSLTTSKLIMDHLQAPRGDTSPDVMMVVVLGNLLGCDSNGQPQLERHDFDS